MDCHEHMGRRYYKFPYSAVKYKWMPRIDDSAGQYSFNLVRKDRETEPIAIIIPQDKSLGEEVVKDPFGGWVPKCFLRMIDPTILGNEKDIAE
jgi:hypothetical protein